MFKLKAWNQIPWLFGEVTLTEKIDGHTAMIHIDRVKRIPQGRSFYPATVVRDSDVVLTIPPKMDDRTGVTARVEVWRVWAQNQNRRLSSHHDMAGLGAWVEANAWELARVLGPGVHTGTWWGYKIRRGYGLPPGERRFSLFNTERWAHLDGRQVPGLYCVPVLWQGTILSGGFDQLMQSLDNISRSSLAVPGYASPQGVILYHRGSNMMFQHLFKDNDAVRGIARRAVR